jgi:hypothetical protein
MKIEIAMVIVTGAAAAFSAIATIVIAAMTYQVWKINKRLVWFTGAMASNAQKSAMIAAKEAKIQPVWWDPSKAPWPKSGPHDTDVDLSKMYFGTRPVEREIPPDI